MKPRETAKDASYWTELKSTLKNKRDIEAMFSKYENLITRNNYSLASLIARETVIHNLEAICYGYSAGDSLEQLGDSTVQDVVKLFLFLLNKTDVEGDETSFEYLFHPVQNGHALHNVYCTLCWLICFDIDHKDMQRIAPVIAKGGQNRLVDLVLREFQPDREMATESVAPAIFVSIDRILDVSAEQRPQILLEHLDHWAERMSLIIRARGIGGASHAILAKSNNDLYDPRIIDGESAATGNFFGGFIGWWAWEVAFAVIVLDIDDNLFADHPLYPVDIVRYRQHRTSNQPWPLKPKGLADITRGPSPQKTSATHSTNRLNVLFAKLSSLEQLADDQKPVSFEQFTQLEDICYEFQQRTDAEIWIPRLFKFIEISPDDLFFDSHGAIIGALESTWPVYLDELYKSIKKQPRGISLLLADRALRGDEEMYSAWRPLINAVRNNEAASEDARDVANEILEGF